LIKGNPLLIGNVLADGSRVGQALFTSTGVGVARVDHQITRSAGGAFQMLLGQGHGSGTKGVFGKNPGCAATFRQLYYQNVIPAGLFNGGTHGAQLYAGQWED